MMVREVSETGGTREQINADRVGSQAGDGDE